MKKRLMLIGPNGVGKTKLAYHFAREHSGQVINLDRTYLYKGFPITTGLQDALKEKGVLRHLYELLEPNEPSYSEAAFLKKVNLKSQQIQAGGDWVIAEGASTQYVPALLEQNADNQFFDFVIGLGFPLGKNVAEAYLRRIDQAFTEGLAEEISSNLEHYKESYLIKECHFAVPTVRYLEGEISLAEAKREILQRCLEYKNRQLELFHKHPQVQWIESSGFPGTYAELKKLLRLS